MTVRTSWRTRPFHRPYAPFVALLLVAILTGLFRSATAHPLIPVVAVRAAGPLSAASAKEHDSSLLSADNPSTRVLKDEERWATARLDNHDKEEIRRSTPPLPLMHGRALRPSLLSRHPIQPAADGRLPIRPSSVHLHQSHPSARKPLSDEELLRKMSFHIPPIPEMSEQNQDRPTLANSLRSRARTGNRIHTARTTADPGILPREPAIRQTEADLDPVLRGNPSKVITGSTSEIQIWYGASVPSAAKTAYESSVTTWSNAFPSSTPVRVILRFDTLDGNTLGATATVVEVPGNVSTSGKLAANTVYLPALAEAIEGTAILPQKYAHISQVFTDNINWNFDPTTQALSDQVDFASVSLHELCHGLFFGGQIVAAPDAQLAEIDPLYNEPERFDRFLSSTAGSGILKGCPNPQRMYQLLTDGDVRYIDTSMSATTNFSLYAPTQYIEGSSTYHLDDRKLYSDCAFAGISRADCSDLMTFSLPPGYNQHNIGTNTLRILASQLGSNPGVVTSSCASANLGNISGGGVTNNPFPVPSSGGHRFPTWAIAVVAVAGALVLIALVLFFVVPLMRRKTAPPVN